MSRSSCSAAFGTRKAAVRYARAVSPKMAAVTTIKKVRRVERGPERDEKSPLTPFSLSRKEAAERPSVSKNDVNSGSTFKEDDGAEARQVVVGSAVNRPRGTTND